MYIIMKGVRIYAFHGVLEQERKIGAYFTIDLRIKCDFSKAAADDELEHTISYADLYEYLKKEMETPSKLLENVCQRICSTLFKVFPQIQAINIGLFKENPPMNCQAEKIGVEVEYER